MLNRRQRAVLDALAPSGTPGLPLGVLDAGFEGFYERWRREADLPMRLGFALALWVSAWVSPVLIGSLPPITRLSPDERERALEALFSSRVYLLRQIALILKAVVCFCYGAHPEVRRAIGYPMQFDDPAYRPAQEAAR